MHAAVDERDFIVQAELLRIAEAYSKRHGFIAAPEIVPIEVGGVIQAGKIFRLPPFVEVTVGDFQDGYRKNVPAFKYDDENPKVAAVGQPGNISFVKQR